LPARLRKPLQPPGAYARAERLRAGDAEAFNGFIEEHWTTLVYYLQHRVRVLEHAQDLAQESFARLWERRETIDPSKSVVAYLYQIARNLVVDELRKLEVRRRWREAGDEDWPAGGPARGMAGPLQRVEEGEAMEALARGVRELSERRREAFILVHVQGLSYREAGQVMGNSPQTVANQVAAALTELRRTLAPHLMGDE
jgi:RNA polymerase sigma factor (sigma-70 family)